MTLTEAKKLMIETMRERKGIHYVLGWLSNSYYSPQDDNIEANVVVKTLKGYGIDIDIEGVI